MIVTLTLNASLDRTVDVDLLERGTLVRTSEPVLEAGGKGVVVARALSANGVSVLGIVAVGGPEGAELSHLLEKDGIVCRFVPVAGRTRSNLTICEPDGTVTKINEPGSPLTEGDITALATAVRTSVRDGDWLVLSGSTPPEFDAARVTTLLGEATAAGASIAVDTSGDALEAALASRPRIVKPNRHELAELVGHDLGSVAEVVEAAEKIRRRGVEYVVVSLGAEGAVLVGPQGMLMGVSPVDHTRSTVGAGDSFLAGFLSRFTVDESDVEGALLEALTWGSAATRLPGSSVPTPSDLDPSNVQLVWQPDLDRPLVAS